MKVVSSNTPEEIECQRAKEEAVRELRDMAANLLRILAGAGRDYELPGQIIKTALAMARIDDLGADSIVAVHQLYNEIIGESRTFDEESGVPTMTQGGLRIMASKMLYQDTQHTAAVRLLLDGVRLYRDHLEKESRRWR